MNDITRPTSRYSFSADTLRQIARAALISDGGATIRTAMSAQYPLAALR